MVTAWWKSITKVPFFLSYISTEVAQGLRRLGITSQ